MGFGLPITTLDKTYYEKPYDNWLKVIGSNFSVFELSFFGKIMPKIYNVNIERVRLILNRNNGILSFTQLLI